MHALGLIALDSSLLLFQLPFLQLPGSIFGIKQLLFLAGVLTTD